MAQGKKTGGRVAGTPNKISAAVRASISKAVDYYYSSDLFAQDMALLKPAERVYAFEKLASYVAPKLQSTTLDVDTESKKTIEDKLLALAGKDPDED